MVSRNKISDTLAVPGLLCYVEYLVAGNAYFFPHRRQLIVYTMPDTRCLQASVGAVDHSAINTDLSLDCISVDEGLVSLFLRSEVFSVMPCSVWCACEKHQLQLTAVVVPVDRHRSGVHG